MSNLLLASLLVYLICSVLWALVSIGYFSRVNTFKDLKIIDLICIVVFLPSTLIVLILVLLFYLFMLFSESRFWKLLNRKAFK